MTLILHVIKFTTFPVSFCLLYYKLRVIVFAKKEDEKRDQRPYRPAAMKAVKYNNLTSLTHSPFQFGSVLIGQTVSDGQYDLRTVIYDFNYLCSVPVIKVTIYKILPGNDRPMTRRLRHSNNQGTAMQ